jgi:hypothetical protein
MQYSRPQGLHSVSDLLRQIQELDTNIQERVSEWIKSAEFRAIDDLVAQVASFRAETHKITWETSSILFQLPQSIFHGWPSHREKPTEGDESLDLASANFSDPNSFLAKGEENCVLQWIWDSQCEQKCPTFDKVREFTRALRKRRVDDGRPWR